MVDITDIAICMDGGTVSFRVTGTDVDGPYRLQTPLLGTPQPLFKNERKLDFGSADEIAVLSVLREWLAQVATAELHPALVELNELKDRRNHSPGLGGTAHLIDAVVKKLSARCE
jgi:hypothetical protein